MRSPKKANPLILEALRNRMMASFEKVESGKEDKTRFLAKFIDWFF